MKKIAAIIHAQAAFQVIEPLRKCFPQITVYSSFEDDRTVQYDALQVLCGELFLTQDAIVFVGSLGICVRSIASCLTNKKTDPAIINIDVKGNYVQPVVSGHVGGANALSEEIARALGAIPVITTVSDTTNLWPLDLLPQRYQWTMECSGQLTALMAAFVNREPTALLLEARDAGTLMMESECPEHVTCFYSREALDSSRYAVILAVTPFVYDLGPRVIYYRPAMISVGLGSQKGISGTALYRALQTELEAHNLAGASVREFVTIALKSKETAFHDVAKWYNVPLHIVGEHALEGLTIPNPSSKVEEVTGNPSVAEACVMSSTNNTLLVEKQKCSAGDKYFTWAAALDSTLQRRGFVDIVGAGPGDPELVSVRGKRLLQIADLILYAGSLVPIALTHYAKKGCVVRSSAGMDLQEQVTLMREFYNRGLHVVRLHTGDPCIYGAIQEQMAQFDLLNMNYRITPGISSFQAAAAALQSQFTIPEEVQSIILTRGEGRTAMPEKEQLHQLARSQSTMCIYLSASIATKVQEELLVHYPDDTPVAVCYKLTWPEQKIYRCTLNNLAKTVKENQLSMTTMIVVGKAIGNREGLSRLYHQSFKHAFRS